MPRWIRLPLELLARVPVALIPSLAWAGAIVLLTLNSDGGVHPMLHAVTGSVVSARGSLAGTCLLIGAGWGVRGLVASRSRNRQLRLDEADPKHPMWTSSGATEYLTARITSRRHSQVARAQVQAWALAAVSVWLFCGADGLAAGLLIGSLCAMVLPVASAMTMVSLLSNDRHRAAEILRAASRVGLENVPAIAARGPEGPTPLARLGVAPGSSVAFTVDELADRDRADTLPQLVATARAAHL